MPPPSLAEISHALAEAGRLLHARGWVPATSGNLSARLGDDRIAITVSGHHKGRLNEDAILLVDLQGAPIDAARTPSAETPLHAALYRRGPCVGAVLHTHSVHATVLSRLAGSLLELGGYELFKAFPGIRSHNARFALPILPNDQDTAALAEAARVTLGPAPALPGFLIAGHGLYAWGTCIDEALRHVEAFECLFECEMLERKLRKP